MPPSLPAAGSDGYYHPTSEAEIRALVLHARAEGLLVRVRGAAHSSPAAIYAGAPDALHLLFDRYAGVHFDDERKRVTVEAGCRFARDPRDPTGRSNDHNGLCRQLDLRGLALPNLGGVSHQTIVGFLATGSAGGSRTHDLAACIASLRLVDGNGDIHVLSEASEREAFLAAGVSLGLLGIVSTITLQCEDRYDVVGEESVTTLSDCPIDLFGDGEDSLERYFAKHDYARVLWWPQPGVDKLVLWTARRMSSIDYDDETGAPGGLHRRPYRAFDPVLGSTLPMQALAGAALGFLGRALTPPAPRTVDNNDNDNDRPDAPETNRLRAALYHAFVPADKHGSQSFRDTWWQGLPLDNAMDERLLPTTFTELWVPVSRAREAMVRLRDHYRRHGFAASGNFVVELYAAKAGRFDLSPSQGEDAVRFNFFWFEKNSGDGDAWLAQFDDLFSDLGARHHWGKHLPDPSHPIQASEPGARWRALYPRFDRFLRMRERFDPKQLFVSNYWRAHLGLAVRHDARLEPALARNSTDPNANLKPDPSAKPIILAPWFALEPSDASFIPRAELMFENVAFLPVTPGEAYDVMTETIDGARWVPGFGGSRWLTGNDHGAGAVFDEDFGFMTLRMRIVEARRGHVWISSVEACSLPLATEMIQEVSFASAGTGNERTHFRWRIHYTPLPDMRRFLPLLRPLFALYFKTITRRLTRYLSERARHGRNSSLPVSQDRYSESQ